MRCSGAPARFDDQQHQPRARTEQLQPAVLGPHRELVDAHDLPQPRRRSRSTTMPNSQPADPTMTK